ncbi:MAG: hypothetical protein ACKOZX_01495 [Gammaproteobacteria bacterium]|jgi:hypothetical protein
MERATSIRNEIGPLLDRLIAQLGDEGRATERAWFARIRRDLNHAHHEPELCASMRALYCTPAVGFALSDDAEPLLLRLVEKAERLGAALADGGALRH